MHNELYNVEGLERKARDAIDPSNGNEDIITFPVQSQVVKAKWIELAEKDKDRYHWRTVIAKGAYSGKEEKHIMGLVGLHITTKDLPNWFWCSFEHVDTERHAEMPSIDSTTRGRNAKHMGRKPGVREETEKSKWENYRLRGTQIDYSNGHRPIILANSMTEHGFQQTSSCMTCHARATIGLRIHRPDLNEYPFKKTLPNTLPLFLTQTEDNAFPGHLPKEPPIAIRYGPVGSPDPNWYRADKNRLRYIQTDFLWEMPFRALSIAEIPPKREAEKRGG